VRRARISALVTRIRAQHRANARHSFGALPLRSSSGDEQQRQRPQEQIRPLERLRCVSLIRVWRVLRAGRIVLLAW
jgi:hypothetical protein